MVHRLVLTFDDGPSPQHTPRILDALADYNVPAVFFVVGERLKAPGALEIVRRAAREGHLIGNLGGSLAQRLGGRPLPAQQAARLVEALAQAMQLAHSRNVVHRDLKPANVLLAADGRRRSPISAWPGNWTATAARRRPVR